MGAVIKNTFRLGFVGFLFVPLVLGAATDSELGSSVSTSLETEPSPISASLTTTLGTTRDRLNSLASFTFEPSLTAPLSQNWTGVLYAELDRPLDPYQNFSMARAYALLIQNIPLVDGVDTALRYYLQANQIDRWSNDGSQVRAVLEAEAHIPVAGAFSVLTRASGFGQANRYRQATDGRDLPRYGFAERVALLFAPAPFNFEWHFIFSQSQTAVWKNGFATAMVAEYVVNPALTVGLSHEFLSSLVDETTGLHSTFRLMDSRTSRWSAYVTVSL